MIGIYFTKTYKKSNKNIKVLISEKGIRLLTKIFNNLKEAFDYKKDMIEKYKTREYTLRSLINYWDYNNQTKFLNQKITS